MIENNLEWGESHFGKEHSDTFACTNQECNRHGSKYTSKEYYSSIVMGVKLFGCHKSRPYNLVCECPECSTKFWFHITEDEARDLAKKFSKERKQ